MYAGAHENELNSEYCQKNTNATISNKWDSIGKRTEVGNELLYLVKGSNCVHDKHKPCDNSNESRCNPGIPSNPLVCESGIHSYDDIKLIIDRAKICNFLIGESLLTSSDIALKLKEFTQINQ